MGQRLHGLACNRAGEGHRPLSQHGDSVGSQKCLIELVGDQHGRSARSGEIPNHLQQQLRLRWSEHAGGLVEEQDSGVAGQRLDDLEPLLEGYRQAAGPLIGIERESHPLTQEPGALAHFVRHARPARRESHVLGDGQGRNRGEMLVHHPDAQAPGQPGDEVIRRGTPSTLISPASGRTSPYATCIRVDFPAPFSPSKRMHLAGGQREIDPAQCMHGAESLVDAGELEHRSHIRGRSDGRGSPTRGRTARPDVTPSPGRPGSRWRSVRHR